MTKIQDWIFASPSATRKGAVHSGMDAGGIPSGAQGAMHGAIAERGTA
jgi:hypothetical protein